LETTYLSYIILIISRYIGIMYKLRYKLPAKSMLTLYNTLILPHLMYCIIVWGCAGKTILDRLLKLQKRCVRIITYSKYMAHTRLLFQKLGIMKIDDIYIVQILLLVYKCRFPPCEIYSCSFFYKYKFLYSENPYNMRQVKRQLQIPFFRTELRRHSISCIGAILFNKFISFSEALSIFTLKKQLKSHFINSNSQLT